VISGKIAKEILPALLEGSGNEKGVKVGGWLVHIPVHLVLPINCHTHCWFMLRPDPVLGVGCWLVLDCNSTLICIMLHCSTGVRGEQGDADDQ
jgi:hypothetical protein